MRPQERLSIHVRAHNERHPAISLKTRATPPKSFDYYRIAERVLPKKTNKLVIRAASLDHQFQRIAHKVSEQGTAKLEVARDLGAIAETYLGGCPNCGGTLVNRSGVGFEGTLRCTIPGCDFSS